MLFKVISLSIKSGSVSFFNSSSGRMALDVIVSQDSITLRNYGRTMSAANMKQHINLSLNPANYPVLTFDSRTRPPNLTSLFHLSGTC